MSAEVKPDTANPEPLSHVEWVGWLCDITKAAERMARLVRLAFETPNAPGLRDELKVALEAYEHERDDRQTWHI